LITIDSAPVSALAPAQSPDAVHVVASVDDQSKVIVPPIDTRVGLAVNVTVGAAVASALTVTTTLLVALPPSPVHVIVYVVVALGVTNTEPLVAVSVVQSATQLVASVEVQLSVAD